MTGARSLLLEPLRVGSLTVPGRVIKSATSETLASGDGRVTEGLLRFYEPIVRAGTPLVITGNLYVSLQAKSTPRQAGIDNDDQLPGLRDWTDMVHRGKGLIFAQLNHAGRQMVESSVPGQLPVSASSVREPLFGVKPRTLGREELPEVIESFAAAAERAQKAGFDGVQIHAAHGYLLNQFLTPHTNRRSDDYGGLLDNRMRLLLETYRAIRVRVGSDYPVIVKLNGSDAMPLRKGATTSEFVAVAKRLQDEGLDGVEVSAGHYESWPATVLGHYKKFTRAQMTEGPGAQLPVLRRRALLASAPVIERTMERLSPGSEGFNLRYAEHFTTALDVPVICVGGFHTAAAMTTAITSGRCDAVAVGRAMIADPYLFAHLRDDAAADKPVCRYNNGCVARVGGRPIDCYAGEIRERKDRMLHEQQTS